MASCAYCAEYPCEMVAKKNIVRSEVEGKYGGKIPEADYLLLIEPYESKKTLEKLRAKKSY